MKCDERPIPPSCRLLLLFLRILSFVYVCRSYCLPFFASAEYRRDERSPFFDLSGPMAVTNM